MLRHVSALLLALAVAAPAQAQFSPSYNFLKAVRERDGGKAMQLLEKNGSTLIDTRDYDTGDRAIHIITRNKDLNWLAFMIGKGAAVDAKDGKGNTALMLAASTGWTDGARLLLAHGAQVDATNSRGETPLILAVQQRDLPMARLLLIEGANPKKGDSVTGMSARDYAVRDGRSDAILKAMDEIKAPPKRAIAGPH